MLRVTNENPDFQPKIYGGDRPDEYLRINATRGQSSAAGLHDGVNACMTVERA